VGNLFGNCSKQPGSSRLMARRTALTGGNAPHRPTPIYHPGPCCCSKPSLSDSDGKPNTPPPSWQLGTRLATVRQLVIKPPEEGTGMEKLLFTIEEAAEVLSVSRSTVYDLVRMRLLDTVLIGRSRRVPASALQDLVDRLHEPKKAA
jgi:excisionase family DNA binding protein